MSPFFFLSDFLFLPLLDFDDFFSRFLSPCLCFLDLFFDPWRPLLSSLSDMSLLSLSLSLSLPLPLSLSLSLPLLYSSLLSLPFWHFLRFLALLPSSSDSSSESEDGCAAAAAAAPSFLPCFLALRLRLSETRDWGGMSRSASAAGAFESGFRT